MSDLGADEVTQEAIPDTAAIVDALPAEQEHKVPDPESLGLDLPDSAEEAIDILLQEVVRARDDATSYLDDLRRVAADFDNYRKRSMREQAHLHQRAAEKVIQGLLPVLDTFDAALNSLPDDAPESDTQRALFSGMINTREQLLKALEAEGLEVIPTYDEVFDPEIHEPAGAPAGSGQLIVGQELRRGYRLNGKVVRAALVVLEVKE